MNSYLRPPTLRDPFNTPKDCKRRGGPVSDPFNPIANASEAHLAIRRQNSSASSTSRSSYSMSRHNSYQTDFTSDEDDDEFDDDALAPGRYVSRSKSRSRSRQRSRARHPDTFSSELYRVNSRLSDRPPPYSSRPSFDNVKPRSKSRDGRTSSRQGYHSGKVDIERSPSNSNSYSRGGPVKSRYDYQVNAIYNSDSDEEDYSPPSPRSRRRAIRERNKNPEKPERPENLWDSFLNFAAFMCFLD